MSEDKPRLADMLDKPKARRKRPLVTQDGTLITYGESYPIAGEPVPRMARDEAQAPASVTFDGAVPRQD